MGSEDRPQHKSQLGLSVRDVSSLAVVGAVHAVLVYFLKSFDALRETRQVPVDIGGFVDIRLQRLFDSFVARQVHNIQVGFYSLCFESSPS